MGSFQGQPFMLSFEVEGLGVIGGTARLKFLMGVACGSVLGSLSMEASPDRPGIQSNTNPQILSSKISKTPNAAKPRNPQTSSRGPTGGGREEGA